MPPLRTLVTPNDFGPVTVTRSRLTKGQGVGARLIVKGNPYSFTADWLTPCLPHLSLAGGQSPASQAARQNLLGSLANDPGTVSNSPAADPGNSAPPGTPPPSPGSGGGGGGGGGGGSVTSGSGGPFAYVTASKTGHS